MTSDEDELLALFAKLTPSCQQELLATARTIANRPSPEELHAQLVEFLQTPHEGFDDEFEIAVEECRYMPAVFWHPHESIY